MDFRLSNQFAGAGRVEASRQVEFRAEQHAHQQRRQSKAVVDRRSDVNRAIAIQLHLAQQGNKRGQEGEEGRFAAGSFGLAGGATGHHDQVAGFHFPQPWVSGWGLHCQLVDARGSGMAGGEGVYCQRRVLQPSRCRPILWQIVDIEVHR